MNAIVRLAKARELAKALEAEDIEKLCKMTGMDNPMFDTLPATELMEILTVRLYNLMKEIGVIEDERQD